jgi:hypothetical protein
VNYFPLKEWGKLYVGVSKVSSRERDIILIPANTDDRAFSAKSNTDLINKLRNIGLIEAEVDAALEFVAKKLIELAVMEE